MLVLTRYPEESLTIGDEIEVTVIEFKGEQVRLGIEAPSDVQVMREEIADIEDDAYEEVGRA